MLQKRFHLKNRDIDRRRIQQLLLQIEVEQLTVLSVLSVLPVSQTQYCQYQCNYNQYHYQYQLQHYQHLQLEVERLTVLRASAASHHAAFLHLEYIFFISPFPFNL